MVFRLVSCAILLIAASARSQAQEWMLTTAEFRSQPVTLQSIDDRGATVVDHAGKGSTIGFDRLLRLARSAGPAPMRVKFMVVLAGGDRTAGEPAAIEGENLIWQNPTLGRMSLPLRSVLSIVRPDEELPPVSAAAQTEDVIMLQNRDRVSGIIIGIDNGNVSIQQSGGAVTPVPLASIARVTFAATATQAAAPNHGFRVALSDGSAITAAGTRLAGDQLELKLPDASDKSIPFAAVRSIEQVNGPVTWLSALTPAGAVQKSFFDLAWPARMDRAAGGGPIEFGNQTYARGIGVHAYSSLTYSIDPAWKTFRTQYAIDGDLPYANVTVRIIVDGRVRHEHLDMRAGLLQPPVLIDVAGHDKLTLEVDFGQNYDVQDRFNWIQPAFLRFTPQPTTESAPTTAP